MMCCGTARPPPHWLNPPHLLINYWLDSQVVSEGSGVVATDGITAPLGGIFRLNYDPSPAELRRTKTEDGAVWIWQLGNYTKKTKNKTLTPSLNEGWLVLSAAAKQRSRRKERGMMTVKQKWAARCDYLRFLKKKSIVVFPEHQGYVFKFAFYSFVYHERPKAVMYSISHDLIFARTYSAFDHITFWVNVKVFGRQYFYKFKTRYWKGIVAVLISDAIGAAINR